MITIKNKKINYLLVCMCFLLIVISGIAWQIVSIQIRFPDFFYIAPNKNISDLVSTSWQVQAAISLLSITLASLMVNSLDNRLYGISIKEALFIKKQAFLLNYWEKILLCILISMGNYIFVSTDMLTSFTLVFIINGILIISIFIDTFAVINESLKLKNRCKNYVNGIVKNIFNYKIPSEDKRKNEFNIIFTNLTAHTKMLISQNNMDAINDNFDLILSTWGMSKNTQHESAITYLIEVQIESILKELAVALKIDEIERIIKGIIIGSDEKKASQYFINSCLQILNSVTLLFQNKEQYFDYNIPSWIQHETFEKSVCIPQVNKYDVAYLLSESVLTIQDNRNISEVEKWELYKYYCKEITTLVFVDKTSDLYTVKKEAIYKICKKLCNDDNPSHFGYLISELFIANRLGVINLYSEKWPEILATILVYLYYVSIREEYFDTDYRETIREYAYLSNNDNISDKPKLIDMIKHSHGELWNYYNEVYEQLTNRSWEKMRMNSVKKCIIDSVVNEFFIFYSICYAQVTYTKTTNFKSLNHNKLGLFLEYFNSDATLKEVYKNNFEKFKIWIGYDLPEHTANSEFYMMLNKIYKESVINENKENRLLVSEISVKEEEYAEQITNIFKKSYFNADKIEGRYIKLYLCDNLTIDVLSGKATLFNNIAEEFLAGFEIRIHNHIQKKFKIFKYSIEDTNKIRRLLEDIELLKDKHGYVIDTCLNSMPSEISLLTYNENEKMRDILKTYEKNINRKGNFYRNYQSILFDQNKVNIQLEVISVKFSDLNVSQIDQQIQSRKQVDDLYQINTDNNLISMMTKDEATTYFKDKYKNIVVHCKLRAQVPKNSGIILEFSNEMLHE